MITIFIKTWRCPRCQAEQDFDPMNLDEMKKNFGTQEDLLGFCPKCLGDNQKILLEKQVDEKKKMTMTILEETDMPGLRAQYESQTYNVILGKTEREETIAEKKKRIDKHLEDLGNLPNSEKDEIRVKLNALPLLKVTEKVYRSETATEKVRRVNDELARLKPANAQKVAELRAKYEDV